jgi:gliding motility-associated lipoprotein GldH
MIKKSNNFLFICLISLLLSSCSNDTLFDQVESFKSKVWVQGDQIIFEVDVEDTLQPFNFEITLRTSTDYTYSNLWIYISSKAPDDVTSKVAQRINIARSDGSWIGKASGTIVESKLLYRTQSFPLRGKYVFTIEQATQNEKIEHVLDLGLRISPHKG